MRNHTAKVVAKLPLGARGPTINTFVVVLVLLSGRTKSALPLSYLTAMHSQCPLTNFVTHRFALVGLHSWLSPGEVPPPAIRRLVGATQRGGAPPPGLPQPSPAPSPQPSVPRLQ